MNSNKQWYENKKDAESDNRLRERLHIKLSLADIEVIKLGKVLALEFTPYPNKIIVIIENIENKP